MVARPTDQLALALGPFQNRALFSGHFLRERLPSWPEMADRRVQPLLDDLKALWRRERAALVGANEAQTENRFIQPVLERLGLEYTVQSTTAATGRRRAPDYALFLDRPTREAAALAPPAGRFRDCVAILEAKAFDRPLDVRAAGALSEDPVAQIVHYVVITRTRWGVLTNGRLWRLYAAEGDLVEGASFEIDLVALLEADDPGAFRYFDAFFARSAFVPDAAGRCFLDRALTESVSHAAQVGEALERQVYAAVPRVAAGLLGDASRTDDALAAAFDHALVVVYRILFCLHAEARGLLPLENPHYRDYSLARLKQGVADDLDRGRRFSARSDDLYNDLRALFRIVDHGDDALGVAEYNGGLFRASGYPWLEGRYVTDALLAPALDAIARTGDGFVDYRDLSVRHLGTIYEGLLAHRLEPDDTGRSPLRLVSASARHEQGAYFTPEAVVDRIVERTLEPLLEERSRAVAARGLRGDAALQAFLGLRVLDPAMGSGHFLVSAAAWIAQYIATDPSYDGDLSLVALQRLVAERCLYGVDASPLAVELAQLSLWLSTVRRDEPLAFLANLRTGNSLVGARVGELLAERERSLFADRLARDTEAMLHQITAIREQPSHSADDVHAKEDLAEAVAALRRPLERYASDALPAALLVEAGPALHWELEFPEVFLSADGRPRADGGFDAVVGNPPYVRIQELGRRLADYCRERFATASGSFDVYVPFVEQGLRLLSPHGRLGFIMPGKFTKLDYARRLRGWLASEGLVEEIVDFGDAQLFPGVTNYTAIVILARAGARGPMRYRRVRGGPEAVRRTLVNLDALPAESYASADLGAEPWVLATGPEADLLRHLRRGSARLDEVTAQIFQGLITSADPVFILEDRGWDGSRRRVWSRASARELTLEPDLLHPLASGGDVQPYALGPLDALLLFPYRRNEKGGMDLLTATELAVLPATNSYLGEHEHLLRGREAGRMDNKSWFAFGRTQSLGLHDHPKLGVAATVRHLEVAIDADGGVHFHNVRVNGILPRPGGVSLWTLLVLLNSSPVDWVFRRGAAPHANGYYAANKQFIAPLPIRVPDAAEARDLDALGRALHATATSLGEERRGFLDWLADAVGCPIRELSGRATLASYPARTSAELIAVLRRNGGRLSLDPTARAFRDLLERERARSAGQLAALEGDLSRDRSRAEDAVGDLYELSSPHRALIAAEV